MSTAPDPGLTDLIAAHRLKQSYWNWWGCTGCDWRTKGTYGSEPTIETATEHAKHVVKQHANGRKAELRLAEAVQGMWRLITKLDETSDGLGDWHDATEYIDWARKEVQEIYVRAALEGEQQ